MDPLLERATVSCKVYHLPLFVSKETRRALKQTCASPLAEQVPPVAESAAFVRGVVLEMYLQQTCSKGGRVSNAGEYENTPADSRVPLIGPQRTKGALLM